MKVSTNKIDALKRELNIEVSSQKVKETFDQVYEQIKKNAKIPGFRPGTAPRHILEKHHFELAREEVIKKLLPESYQEALETENLDAISLPQITDLNLTGDSLRYKAKVEIRPTIEIKNYKKIKIKKRSNDISDEALEKALDNVKKARKIESVDEDFAHSLGYAKLDELKDAFRRELIMHKETENKMQLEAEVIEHLLQNAKFSIPESMLSRRFQELQQELKKNLTKSNLAKEEIEKKENELEPKLKEQAEEQVRVFLILDEIARIEGIERNEQMPQKVMEFLFKNADWTA